MKLMETTQASLDHLTWENPMGEARKDALRLRAYPNNPLYCGQLQSPMPALSVKKCSQRGENHFWRAFLACRLGLELFARPHNDPVIRISS